MLMLTPQCFGKQTLFFPSRIVGVTLSEDDTERVSQRLQAGNGADVNHYLDAGPWVLMSAPPLHRGSSH